MHGHIPRAIVVRTRWSLILSCYTGPRNRIGTEFMDKLRLWLQAIPGDQCIRAGAGAYADALLPSTMPARFPTHLGHACMRHTLC